MSWSTVNYGYWEFWTVYDPANDLYGEQKCIFDGENRIIYINPEVSDISVKEDVYSGWKEWTLVRDNSKFPDAVRVTGGDPIGGGSFSGDIYFLINGWRIFLDHTINIDGVIFSDDFPSPFFQSADTFLVTNKVSALVQTVEAGTGGGSGATAAEIWNHPTRTLTSAPLYNGPSVTQIRQEIDANSTELAAIKALATTSANAPAPTAAQIRQEIDTNSTELSSIKALATTAANAPAPTAAQIRQEIDTNSTELAAIKTLTTSISNDVAAAPTAAEIADAVRAELTPELTHLLELQNGQGLNSTQATMLLEIYRLYGLDPTRPLVVTKTRRTAGDLVQNIDFQVDSTRITRD